MPDLFSTTPGTVTKIGGNALLPMQVTLGGWGGYSLFKAIIAQAGVRRGGRYQFMYTLRDFIYVYVFGEKLGEITIAGVAFPGACAKDGVAFNDKTGFELVLGYYEKYRLSRTGLPITITIATTSFSAFLTDIDLGIQDPATQLTSFTMKFLFPPRPEAFATFTNSLLDQLLELVGQLLPGKDAKAVLSAWLGTGGENETSACCSEGG